MLNKRLFFICIAILSLLPLQAQKVGLVLSGGGAKGAVHIGVIKALEDNDIPIDYIAGTSIGAIVGSLYAMGYTPDEMLNLFLSDEFYYWQSGKIEEDYSYFFRKPTETPEFTKFTIPLKDSIDLKAAIMPTSLINPIQMNQAFMSLYAPATAQCQGDFNRLFVPFLCVASDVFNKTPVIFRSGDIGDAVRASMTFPFFFRPIIHDSIPLYDGGIYDNFPVKPMKQAFSPDFIIGCSVAGGNKKKPVNQDLYDQIENMIMQRTDYFIDPEDGVVLNFKLNNVSLLDFNKSRNLFRLGYRRGMQMVDSIKGRISARRDLSEVNERRREFRSQQLKMIFKNIYINGVNESQKKYIESQLHRNANKQFTMEDFKQSYFRLLADTKIKEIVPHAVYNPENNTFDLYLDVTVNNEIMIAFGGNISSSNANQLYIGLGYQSLTEYSTNINLDMQMGNTYNGVVLHGRLEVPSRIPLYLTGTGVYNYRKYYDSEKLFIDTELSTFIHQRETYGKLGIGLPFKTKAKIEMLFGYGNLEDKYYQSNTESFFGTSFDRSKYNLFSLTASIKKNTLDAKQYPIFGQEHFLIAQYLSGNEIFVPAKSDLSTTKEYQSWVQLKGRVNNYHNITPKFNLGYIAEAVLSNKNLLSNYTSSILQAPAFTPTLHSKMVFNESWHANQYIAGGITPIFNLSQTVHLRGDFDAFLPLYPIKRSSQGTAPRYGSLFSDVSYMGELSFVVRLSFMSISLYGNYYNFPKDNWNFGINIGYLIFGPKFIQ